MITADIGNDETFTWYTELPIEEKTNSFSKLKSLNEWLDRLSQAISMKIIAW